MIRSEYIKLAIRTEAQPPAGVLSDRLTLPVYRINHALLGLVSEMQELREAETLDKDGAALGEEYGDLFWYAALLADAVGLTDSIDAAKIPKVDTLLFTIEDSVGIIADQIKRALYYGKPLDVSKLHLPTLNIWGSIESMAHYTPAAPRIAEIMEANIAKLRKRYPVKFTEENAINRNLDAEREALVHLNG